MKIKKSVQRPFVMTVIFFLGAFALFAGIFTLSNGHPIPDDEYFHFRYAYLLRTEGWDAVKNFDWIYLSHGAENGTRYAVNLYQVSLIPFTYFSDQLFGLHVAIAFYISVVLAIMFYVLRKEHIRHPLLYILLVVASTYLMSRMLLGRAYVLIIGLVFLEMFFAIHKRYVPLAVVVVLHVLWHQTTYFLPAIIIGMVEVSRYMIYQKIQWRTCAYTISAIVGGMIFFPGFPGSLVSWMRGIFAMQGAGDDTISGSLGGAEMATKDFMTYFAGQEVMLFLLLVCIGCVVLIYMMRKRENITDRDMQHVDVHWVYSLFFLVLLVVYGSIVVSGRFYDFVLPTVCMLSAFVIHALSRLQFFTVMKGSFSRCMIGAVYVWVGILCVNVMITMYAKANEFDYAPAQSAAQWIDEQSAGREKVFVHNWGNFTLMFFGNTNNVYSTGIEPTTLKNYDPALYWKYYNMLKHNFYCEYERDCKDIVDKTREYLDKMDPTRRNEFQKENGKKILISIKNDFDAKFIVSDSPELDDMLLANPDLIENVFRTQSEKFEGKHMSFTMYKLK